MSAETIGANNDASITTLPLDLLTNITKTLDERDEKALKLTCKRMNLLIAPPMPGHIINNNHEDGHHGHHYHNNTLTVGVSRDLVPQPRDDGSLPAMPQSPLPFKASASPAAAALQEQLALENKDVEEREADREMELSDDESVATTSNTNTKTTPHKNNPRKKYQVKKSILHWTAELDSAPASPSVGGGGFVLSPRVASPAPAVPTFTLTIQ